MFELKIIFPHFKKAVKYTHRTLLLLWAGDSPFPSCVPFPCVLYHTGRVSACPAACCRVAEMLGRGWVFAELKWHSGASDCQHTLSWRCGKSSVSRTWSMDHTECLLGTYVGVLICPGCMSLTIRVVLLPMMGCVRLTACNVSCVWFSLDNLGQKCRSQDRDK